MVSRGNNRIPWPTRRHIIPRYVDNRYEWRIGETTDDTEQTLAVARALLTEGEVSHVAIGRELLQCKKSAHPGVSLWSFLQVRDPARIASNGDGCGAAMRAGPVGVLYPSSSSGYRKWIRRPWLRCGARGEAPARTRRIPPGTGPRLEFCASAFHYGARVSQFGARL